jgi:hypothetical protein
MYSVKDKYRNPSPPRNLYAPPCPTSEVPPETEDPMGLAELISATTLTNRGAGTRNAHLSPGGVGKRNVHLSPCNLGMTEAAAMMVKAAAIAGANAARTDAENLTAEARGLSGPRANLRRHHPVGEVEAEAGGRTPAQNPLSTCRARVMQGNVSTNI